MNLPPDEVLKNIREELFRGNKIAAIKRYREHVGGDLKDAKEAVEALEAQLRAQTPGMFQHPAGKGCAGLIVVGLTLVGLGLWAAGRVLA